MPRTKSPKVSVPTAADEAPPEKPKPLSTSSPESRSHGLSAAVLAALPVEASAEDRVSRSNLGRFVKGVSGNKSGRPQGSKNRTSQMKQFIEEAMTLHFSDDVLDIFATAVQMAKDGDQKMIALLIGDFMKEVRAPDVDAVAEARARQAPGSVSLSITHHHHAAPAADVKNGVVLDAEFSKSTE